MSHIKKWIKLGLFIAFLLFLIWLNYGAIGMIQSKNIRAYSVNSYMDSKNNVELCCLSDGTPWSKQIYHSNYNSIYYLILAFIDIVAIICFILLLKSELYTKIFFIISMISGIVVSLLIPPVSRPDEYRHFIRAYEISQGR